MHFAVGEHRFKSGKPKNPDHGKVDEDWCRWDERFGGKDKPLKLPYHAGKYLPTFYLYLVDDDDVEVCYYRGSVEDFKDKNGPIHW